MKTKKTLRRSGIALTLLCGLGGAVSGPANAQYQFTNFDGGGNNGGGTTINGLNNNGVEVGFSMDGGMTINTNFLRNPNGTFTFLNVNGDPLAMANGVNNALSVVGGSNNNAFLLNNNSFQALPQANPGNTAAEVAFGINDGGTIVGQYTDNVTDTTPGFVYKNGVFTILNPVNNAAVTNAQGINNHGLVTGFFSTDGAHQHGFFYDTNTNSYTLAPDPNIANLFLTQFLGINDNNEVAGYYQTNDGSQHGFLFNPTTDGYKFLDDPAAANLGGVSITQITGIDNKGDLSGFYVGADGLQHGFFAAAVPEPGTVALFLASGVFGAGFLARKRKRG